MRDIQISPDGAFLYVLGEKKPFRKYFDLRRPKPLLLNQKDWGEVIAHAPDMHHVLARSQSGELRVLPVDAPGAVALEGLTGFPAKGKIAFSPDGKKIAVLRSDLKDSRDFLLIFDSQTGKQLEKIPDQADFDGFKVAYGSIQDFSYDPDGVLWVYALDYEDERYFAFPADGGKPLILRPPLILPEVEANFGSRQISSDRAYSAFSFNLRGTKSYRHNDILERHPLDMHVIDLKTGRTVFDEDTLPGWRHLMFLEGPVTLLKGKKDASSRAFFSLKEKKILASFQTDGPATNAQYGYFSVRTDTALTLWEISTGRKVWEKELHSLSTTFLDAQKLAVLTPNSLDILSVGDGQILGSIPVKADLKKTRLTFLSERYIAARVGDELIVLDLVLKKEAMRGEFPTLGTLIILPWGTNRMITSEYFTPGIADFRVFNKPKNTVKVWEWD